MQYYGGYGRVIPAKRDSTPTMYRGKSILDKLCLPAELQQPGKAKRNNISKKVMHLKTGKIYESISAAARAEGISAPGIRKKLSRNSDWVLV